MLGKYEDPSSNPPAPNIAGHIYAVTACLRQNWGSWSSLSSRLAKLAGAGLKTYVFHANAYSRKQSSEGLSKI